MTSVPEGSTSGRLRKVEELLSRSPGEDSSGYISAQDLLQAFTEVFIALEEVRAEIPAPPDPDSEAPSP